MNQYIDNIIDAIKLVANDSDQLTRIKTLSTELAWSSDEEINFLLSQIIAIGEEFHAGIAGAARPNLSAVDASLEFILARLVNEFRQQKSPSMSAERIRLIRKLYEEPRTGSRVRSYLLGWLASSTSDEALRQFTELMVSDPPRSSVDIVIAFAPLITESREFSVSAVFPRLLDALEHTSVAAAVLDLANFLTRRRPIDRHPAAARVKHLVQLLGMMSRRLSQLESGQLPGGLDPSEVSQVVEESVSLITSLSDAVSLIGDPCAIPTLREASQLKHRRIRTETLSALCRLGESDAAPPLIELAAEPVVRLRVLTYAGELNLLDRVPDRYRSPVARAESELAMWLALPTNMGLAPSELQLVESRPLAWPSYERPQESFLFKYCYRFSGQQIENIGIAGPLTHAFTSSLLHLETADVFACFAGWHCDHEEIRELTIEQARDSNPGVIERLMSRLAGWLHDDRIVLDAQPSFLGIFMGEPILVASGCYQNKIGTFVIDENEVSWFEPGGDDTAAADELAYCIYKGRKLLGAFNSPEIWPGINAGNRKSDF